MTYMTWKYSGSDYSKIIGSGTLLDTARLKSELSKRYNTDINNINGYVLGEHGDSQFIAWSSVNIEVPDNDKTEISDTVRKLGFEISHYQGFTSYGIGNALYRITKSIILDIRKIFTSLHLYKRFRYFY